MRDAAYFNQRAAHFRQMATLVTDEAISALLHEMAREYAATAAEIAAMLEERPRNRDGDGADAA